MKKYDSFKVVVNMGTPQRRETEQAALNLAQKLHKSGRHGQIEGVWFDDSGIHFDVIKKF